MRVAQEPRRAAPRRQRRDQDEGSEPQPLGGRRGRNCGPGDAPRDDHDRHDRADVALLVELRAPEGGEHCHGDRKQDEDHPGEMAAPPARRQAPQPDRRQDEQGDVVTGQRPEQRHEIKRQVGGEDRRDAVVPDVDAAARGRDPHEAGDHLVVAGAVLQVDAQRSLLLVLEHAIVLDEPLILEQLGDAHLQLAGGNVHLLVLRAARVADACQHVGDRIAAHAYQLAFTMPGTSPFSASSRKHRRHIWNFRR